MIQFSQFISDYNGEDQFVTRMGVGGIINVEKLKQVQQVLDDIRAFHYHKQKRDDLFSVSLRYLTVQPSFVPPPASFYLIVLTFFAQLVRRPSADELHELHSRATSNQRPWCLLHPALVLRHRPQCPAVPAPRNLGHSLGGGHVSHCLMPSAN